MAKKKKKEILVFSTVLKKGYKLSDGVLSEIEVDGKVSPNYVCSYLPASYIKYASISVGTDGEESSEELVANKTYEELGLDIETDYEIRYAIAENQSEGNEDVYNVFATETANINNVFKEAVKKLDYIDYIDAEPLLYSAYYSSSIFDAQGLDVYVYMHKDYATLTIYKDGEICAFRCLNKLSLEALHASYCQEIAERIPEAEFLEELRSYGLDHPDSTKRIALHSVFANVCLLLANNISFTMRKFRAENEGIANFCLAVDGGAELAILEKFKALFASFKSSDADVILEAMLENNTQQNDNSVSVKNFQSMHKIKCELFKNSKSFLDENEQSTLDPLVIMMLYRANEQLKEANEIFNISLFLRPPPFTKRQSGQLIIATCATLLLASVYPLYNFASGYLISLEKDALNDQIPPRQRIHDALKQQIAQLNNQVNALQDEINGKDSKLNLRISLLNRLYDKKVNYALKAKIISKLSEMINNSGVKLIRAEGDGRVIRVQLIGTNLAITNFIKSVGSNENYELRSPNIDVVREQLDDSGIFVSDVEIGIRQ